ncbi:MAG: substrate-binding domain-containing protein [Verrucomicrobiota bacterium]
MAVVPAKLPAGFTPRIALAFQTVQPHLERVTRGILDFANQSGGWHLSLNPEGAAVTLESLQSWDGDGILAMIETQEQADIACKLSIPVVNLSARLPQTTLPSVSSDNWAIGKSAAEHLLERGFRRCGFYGLANVWYSEERFRGFKETIEAAGGHVSALITQSSLGSERPWDWDRASLENWLRSLNPHTGVMAVHDYRAQLLLETARRMGRIVPDEIAVIGVNNDPVACDGSIPALSSVPQDGYQIGQQAAELLTSLLTTPQIQTQQIHIAPLKVHARKSTETFGVDDPVLRSVLQEIEARLHVSFGVDELAAKVGFSRRWLEQLFSKHLLISPHLYIVRRRVWAARQILTEEHAIKPAALARRCGFPSTRSLKAALSQIP